MPRPPDTPRRFARAPQLTARLPFELLLVILQLLACEYTQPSRAALARLMRTGQTMYDIAGQALYHKIPGSALDTLPARKCEFLLSTKVLVLDRQCRLGDYVTAGLRLDELLPSVRSISMLPRFLLDQVEMIEGDPRTTPLSPDLDADPMEPPGGPGMRSEWMRRRNRMYGLLAQLKPRVACIALPRATAAERDAYLDSKVSPALRVKLGREDRLRVWGSAVGGHYLHDVVWLTRHWELDTLVVHDWGFHIPRSFNAETVRYFASDAMPQSNLFSFPRGPLRLLPPRTEWDRASAQLEDYCDIGPRGRVLEYANVGAGMPVETGVAAHKQKLEEYKEELEVHMTKLRVGVELRTPHWSDAAPCQCCGGRPAPSGDDEVVQEPEPDIEMSSPKCGSPRYASGWVSAFRRLNISVGCESAGRGAVL